MNTEQKQEAERISAMWSVDGYNVKLATDALKLCCELAEIPEPEQVGYLYTNVQSGEFHVSDYDDDYRGPERALWYIEPVYRRTKG